MAGVDLAVTRGDRVEAGAVIARVAAADAARLEAAAERVRAAVELADERPAPRSAVLEEVR